MACKNCTTKQHPTLLVGDTGTGHTGSIRCDACGAEIWLYSPYNMQTKQGVIDELKSDWRKGCQRARQRERRRKKHE